MKIEIDVDIPPGFEATGEFRSAQVGEWFLHTRHGISRACNSVVDTISNRIILRKVPQPPTMEHAGKNVLVRQFDGEEWRTRPLLYINRQGFWCYNATKDSDCAFLWPQARLMD